MKNKANEFKNKDLHSGYLVEFRNGDRRIVARVNDFTRVLVNPTFGVWNYLSEWGDDLKLKKNIRTSHVEASVEKARAGAYDIVKVFGLVKGTGSYCFAFSTCTDNLRPLLWERKEPVKMTVAEICAKLGYDVEIVSEASKHD